MSTKMKCLHGYKYRFIMKTMSLFSLFCNSNGKRKVSRLNVFTRWYSNFNKKLRTYQIRYKSCTNPVIIFTSLTRFHLGNETSFVIGIKSLNRKKLNNIIIQKDRLKQALTIHKRNTNTKEGRRVFQNYISCV